MSLQCELGYLLLCNLVIHWLRTVAGYINHLSWCGFELWEPHHPFLICCFILAPRVIMAGGPLWLNTARAQAVSSGRLCFVPEL